MNAIVASYMAAITLGEATHIDGFTAVPLFSEKISRLNYGTLQTAMSTNVVKVREVSTAGSVGDLVMSNTGGTMVLALDGEELEGAKQNRILNTTVLIAGGSDLMVPVSCTEQGRWAYVTPECKASESFATPRIRENAKRAVNRALEEDRGFRANQGEIWDGVVRLSRETGVRSPTLAMNDIVKSRLPELDQLLESVPVHPGQCGVLVAAGGDVLGFDIVSRPDAYAQLHRRLVRSYLLENARKAIHAGTGDVTNAVAHFLKMAADTSERRFESLALGEDYRYENTHVVGSALVYSEEMVHAAFFTVPPEDLYHHASQMRGARARAHYRSEGTTQPDPNTR